MKIYTRIKGMDISTLVEEEKCGARYFDDGEEGELIRILGKYGTNYVRIRLWNDPYGDRNPEETGSGEEPAGSGESSGRCRDEGYGSGSGENCGISSDESCDSEIIEKREKYGAGTNDLDTAIILAKRAKAAGMKVLLDFHYSDFWADPGKQFPPKAWKDYGPEQLVKAVYEYTGSVLKTMRNNEVLPDMVQVGNELTNGCCWPLGRRDFVVGAEERAETGVVGAEERAEASPSEVGKRDETNMAEGEEREKAGQAASEAGREDKNTPYFNPVLRDIISAGLRAVREADPGIITMIHLDNGGNNGLYREWFDGYFGCGGDDFDVIGLSYYPFWHGNMVALKHNMDDIAMRYHKELVIAEVSMGFTTEDYSAYEGLDASQRKGMATKEHLLAGLDYPMSPEGQTEFMKHLNRIIDEVPERLGRGYFYWEPGWIPVPGCGWATPASLEYIHDKGPCGNEWANQALFDFEGNALPALKV